MEQDDGRNQSDDMAGTHLTPDYAGVCYEKGKMLLQSFLEGHKYNQVIGEIPELLREAETCFINALKIDQNHRHAQILLGKIFFLTGRMREATILLGNALDLPPYSPDWTEAPGVICMGMTAGDESPVRIIKKYRKFFPEDTGSLALLARGYFYLNLYDKSEPLLEELLERDPVNYPYQRSCLEFIKNDLKKLTKEELEKIAESGKKIKELTAKMMGEVKIISEKCKTPEDWVEGMMEIQAKLLNEIKEMAGDNEIVTDFRFEVK